MPLGSVSSHIYYQRRHWAVSLPAVIGVSLFAAPAVSSRQSQTRHCVSYQGLKSKLPDDITLKISTKWALFCPIYHVLSEVVSSPVDFVGMSACRHSPDFSDLAVDVIDLVNT
eukprot:scaffold204662_cov53-Cyclotella_meneghiniana.AAC.1